PSHESHSPSAGAPRARYRHTPAWLTFVERNDRRRNRDRKRANCSRASLHRSMWSGSIRRSQLRGSAERHASSELFAHGPGAFTGAKSMHRGVAGEANGGSLFLDKISEMDPSLQVKLLTAIEARRLRRLGGEREIRVDIQVMAATNRFALQSTREVSSRPLPSTRNMQALTNLAHAIHAPLT